MRHEIEPSSGHTLLPVVSLVPHAARPVPSGKPSSMTVVQMNMRTTIIAAALLISAAAARADRVVTHEFTASASAPGVRSLLVDIPAGEIHVVNGAAGTIHLAGVSRRDYDAWDRRDATQKIVDDVSAEVYVNGGEAVVRRRFGPNAQSWRSQKFTNLSVTIEVPAGTSISFDTSFGEIHMDGSFGNIDADLRAGEIHLDTPRADVKELNASARVGEVHTNDGAQIVSREGVFPGKTHFENPAGRTRVNVHVTAGEIHVRLSRAR
jgi:hypothetical protein